MATAAARRLRDRLTDRAAALGDFYIKDGGPAFAAPAVLSASDDLLIPSQIGMSLRDYFASQALIGLASSATLTPAQIVTRCYLAADLLLLERLKPH